MQKTSSIKPSLINRLEQALNNTDPAYVAEYTNIAKTLETDFITHSGGYSRDDGDVVIEDVFDGKGIATIMMLPTSTNIKLSQNINNNLLYYKN